jgi:DUF1365 family protein
VSADLASAIYRGQVQHRRHAPRPHAFRYPLFMLYLDLDELPRLFEGRWLWSVNRRNIAEFRRSDYLGDPTRPLKDCVLDEVEKATAERPRGAVRLLTHLRYFGHCFNPVSFYYCFDVEGAGERLHSIVAEITNTPWKERHRYVLALRDGEPLGPTYGWDFRKAFHVSPFLPLERDYRWRFGTPDESLLVHMDSRASDGKDFDATLSLRREPLTAGNLARCLLRHPAMTLKVVWAIHWQALLIWCKRNPVYDHPGH